MGLVYIDTCELRSETIHAERMVLLTYSLNLFSQWLDLPSVTESRVFREPALEIERSSNFKNASGSLAQCKFGKCFRLSDSRRPIIYDVSNMSVIHKAGIPRKQIPRDILARMSASSRASRARI